MRWIMFKVMETGPKMYDDISQRDVSATKLLNNLSVKCPKVYY